MTTFFAYDWEATTLSVDGGSATPVYAGGAAARSVAFAHNGTHSMYCNPGSGDDFPSGINAPASPDLTVKYGTAVLNSPSLYYRWWMMIRTGFSFGSGSKQKVKISRTCVNNFSAPGGGLVYTGYMNSGGFDLSEGYWCGTDSAIMSGGDHFAKVDVPGGMTPYIDNTWHEYIVRVKPNTGATLYDGQMELWIDNVQIGSYNAFRLISNAANDGGDTNWANLYGSAIYGDLWGGMFVCPYWQMNGAGAGGDVYVDQVSTDSTYNSLIGGGSTYKYLAGANQ